MEVVSTNKPLKVSSILSPLSSLPLSVPLGKKLEENNQTFCGSCCCCCANICCSGYYCNCSRRGTHYCLELRRQFYSHLRKPLPCSSPSQLSVVGLSSSLQRWCEEEEIRSRSLQHLHHHRKPPGNKVYQQHHRQNGEILSERGSNPR